jgi:hypothetical protein
MFPTCGVIKALLSKNLKKSHNQIYCEIVKKQLFSIWGFVIH